MSSIITFLEKEKNAATNTAQSNRVENAPLRPVKEIEKLQRGSADVGIDNSANIAFLKWKNNKMVTVIHKDIFACLFSIHNIISLSCHEQVSLSGLRFERYFSHHRAR